MSRENLTIFCFVAEANQENCRDLSSGAVTVAFADERILSSIPIQLL